MSTHFGHDVIDLIKIDGIWQLPDGVYLNLPEEDYFGQVGRLGSTDVKTLAKKREGWWWSSALNPHHKPKDRARPELVFGSALHAILLEGVAAYESRYIVAPEKEDYDDLCVTIDDMKAALKEAGFNTSTSSYKAQDWADAMAQLLPDRACWPNIMGEFNATRGTRTPIALADDVSLRFMREVATDPERRDNEAVRFLFEDTEHPALSEVTVLWTEDGVKRRGRIDRLYPAFTLDLKSLQNWNGRALEHYCGDLIAKAGYDIQRADHQIARNEAFIAIEEGRLYGGSPEERRWIEAICEADKLRQDPAGYVWLFFQKPDMSAGTAPVLFPVFDRTHSDAFDDPDYPQTAWSEIMSAGMGKRDRALDFFREAMATWGPDRPWARVERLHYTEETRVAGQDRPLPRIFLPHWIRDTRADQESDQP